MQLIMYNGQAQNKYSHTEGEQNNRNAKKVRQRICVRYAERISVGCAQCSSSICVCNVGINALLIMTDGPCQSENGRIDGCGKGSATDRHGH
jgi:hypothetical protein